MRHKQMFFRFLEIGEIALYWTTTQTPTSASPLLCFGLVRLSAVLPTTFVSFRPSGEGKRKGNRGQTSHSNKEKVVAVPAAVVCGKVRLRSVSAGTGGFSRGESTEQRWHRSRGNRLLPASPRTQLSFSHRQPVRPDCTQFSQGKTDVCRCQLPLSAAALSWSNSWFERVQTRLLSLSTNCLWFCLSGQFDVSPESFIPAAADSPQ